MVGFVRSCTGVVKVVGCGCEYACHSSKATAKDPVKGWLLLSALLLCTNCGTVVALAIKRMCR
ncbi:hypothetical protein M378DRAFT_161986 [Amanita muscaria Koide BX008]|uniref:Uncharacterized protein n=1 Tax=Amanita muscaria (strain Koide BX008) TaxID=946122 RepID=A0A0C2X9A8_AMAMK|nr:hypothetical protein M378DRAFT_161986 [Amanita muscaria Koide BX008]